MERALRIAGLREDAVALPLGERRSQAVVGAAVPSQIDRPLEPREPVGRDEAAQQDDREDRKSTRLNSSHLGISYAVFCLKKKKKKKQKKKDQKNKKTQIT